MGDAPWPGARRRSMMIAALLIPIAWPFLLQVAGPFLTPHFGPILMEQILSFAAFVPLLVILHFTWKRLTNLGMSHWWLFASLAPGLNLWLSYRCLVCPAGYAYHKQLDRIGVFLAIAYWLFLIILAAIVAIVAIQLIAPMDSINLRDILQSLITKVRAAKLST
jgi:hypothetical protein